MGTGQAWFKDPLPDVVADSSAASQETSTSIACYKYAQRITSKIQILLILIDKYQKRIGVKQFLNRKHLKTL